MRTRASALLMSLLILPPLSAQAGDTTVWTFDSPQTPFAADSGRARLELFDPEDTEWDERVRVGTPAAFGLPDIAGQGSGVLFLPAAPHGGGLRLSHPYGPNGTQRRFGRVGNYTLVMDVLWPRETDGRYRAVLQTGVGDAELFVQDRSSGGLGVMNNYHGAVEPGRWHRVAIVVRAALGEGGVGHILKFIDGRFVGSHITPGMDPPSRWSLGPEFLLFSDDDGENEAVYLAGLLFSGRAYSMAEVEALGGPAAEGPGRPGEPPPPETRRAQRPLMVFGHRGGSCCAPENTLASIARAFALGADHVEIDVRVTSDGKAILMHDDNVARVTDGEGRSSQLSWRRLRRLDAGSWFSDEFRKTRVPLLSDALRAIKGKGGAILDVKPVQAGEAIARAMREADFPAESLWFYVGPSTQAAADLRPWIPGARILMGGVPPAPWPESLAQLKAVGIVGFELEALTVTEEFVKAAHDHGLAVFSYTAFSPEEMLKTAALGVDGIETDFPHVLRGLLPPKP